MSDPHETRGTAGMTRPSRAHRRRQQNDNRAKARAARRRSRARERHGGPSSARPLGSVAIPERRALPRPPSDGCALTIRPRRGEDATRWARRSACDRCPRCSRPGRAAPGARGASRSAPDRACQRPRPTTRLLAPGVVRRIASRSTRSVRYVMRIGRPSMGSHNEWSAKRVGIFTPAGRSRPD